MNRKLRRDAETIVRSAIEAVKPDEAVRRALEQVRLTDSVYLVAVGKAAWQMAAAALSYLDRPIQKGIVVTKYDHVMAQLPHVVCLEAGHPVPDEGSFRAAQAVLELTGSLRETDTVLFLLSGGGSALFEKPLVEPRVMQEVTRRLLAAGADITKINTIRKRLSTVKGGRFAAHCAPAKIEAIVLSDVLGDRLDMIASGPAAADPVTKEEAMAIAREYSLESLPGVMACLEVETPKAVPNVRTQVIGSVAQLCGAAGEAARKLGYRPVLLSDCLNGEASDTGRELARELLAWEGEEKTALIWGGETVVHVKGTGLGGRNQELALAAAELLAEHPGRALISAGSDGTDGPTDAAGGYCDGDTLRELTEKDMDIRAYLQNNDAYHALGAIGNLILTGPTGTNVNDVTIGLIG